MAILVRCIVSLCLRKNDQYGDMHNICLSSHEHLNILLYGTQPVRVQKIYRNALIPAFPLVGLQHIMFTGTPFPHHYTPACHSYVDGINCIGGQLNFGISNVIALAL